MVLHCHTVLPCDVILTPAATPRLFSTTLVRTNLKLPAYLLHPICFRRRPISLDKKHVPSQNTVRVAFQDQGLQCQPANMGVALSASSLFQVRIHSYIEEVN